MNTELENLHNGIRSGSIRCQQPHLCNPSMGQHAPDCRWDKAVQRIYEIRRADK